MVGLGPRPRSCSHQPLVVGWLGLARICGLAAAGASLLAAARMVCTGAAAVVESAAAARANSAAAAAMLEQLFPADDMVLGMAEIVKAHAPELPVGPQP
jgi:hypothetical protein